MNIDTKKKQILIDNKFYFNDSRYCIQIQWIQFILDGLEFKGSPHRKYDWNLQSFMFHLLINILSQLFPDSDLNILCSNLIYLSK